MKFTSPNKKFLIGLPDNWEVENKSLKGDGPYQFLINENMMFQISCVPIDEHIKQVIKHNKLSIHDFQMPNYSFKETANTNSIPSFYSWLCWVEDYLIMAVLFYDPRTSPKEFPLDLMTIRMALQNMHFISKTAETQASKVTQEDFGQEKDYLLIENWRNIPEKFHEYTQSKDKDSFDIKHVKDLQIDPLKVYSLLRAVISKQPNGLYANLRLGKPLDSPFWWDYVLECDLGFIHLFRTSHGFEALYLFEKEFNIIDFFNRNIKTHAAEIQEEIQLYENHIVYINHYKSYDECVRYLWEEVKLIDLTLPKPPNQKDKSVYKTDISKFIKTSIKFHTLGKSLLLNSAFKIDSFINLVIRIGSSNKLKKNPEVLERYLKADFMYKIKCLRFYTKIFSDEFDYLDPAIKAAQELMVLRNKYVHFDEKSDYNKLGEVYFDGDFPLHPLSPQRPHIAAFVQIFHNPTFEMIERSVKTSDDFVKYLKSKIKEEYRPSISFLVEQNPISYNSEKMIYSSIYPEIIVDFFAE